VSRGPASPTPTRVLWVRCQTQPRIMLWGGCSHPTSGCRSTPQHCGQLGTGSPPSSIPPAPWRRPACLSNPGKTLPRPAPGQPWLHVGHADVPSRRGREQRGQSRLPASCSRSSTCGTPSSPPQCGVSSSCPPARQPGGTGQGVTAEPPSPTTPQLGLVSLCHIRTTFPSKSMKYKELCHLRVPCSHPCHPDLILTQRAARDCALPLVFGARQPPTPPAG